MGDETSDLKKYGIEKPGETSITQMLQDFAAREGAFAGPRPKSTEAWVAHPAANILGAELALFGGAIMALEERLVKLERQANGKG
jgi:hypothetical protein